MTQGFVGWLDFSSLHQKLVCLIEIWLFNVMGILSGGIVPMVLAQGGCCVEVLPGLTSIFNLVEEKDFNQCRRWQNPKWFNLLPTRQKNTYRHCQGPGSRRCGCPSAALPPNGSLQLAMLIFILFLIFFKP